MKFKLIFTIAFIIVVLTEIIADLNGYAGLVYVSKPLILLLLIGYSNFTFDERIAPRRPVFIAGLWFALLGDIFLMVRERDMFVPGLGSFLITQIMYTYSFSHDGGPAKTGFRKALISFLPFSAFAAALYLILLPQLSGMLKVAVGIYACFIATMSWMSLLRRRNVSNQSFLMVFLGALLFMMSDSLIAIDRFVIPIPLNTIWVMSTYAAAQYLIVIGFLKTK